MKKCVYAAPLFFLMAALFITATSYAVEIDDSSPERLALNSDYSRLSPEQVEAEAEKAERAEAYVESKEAVNQAAGLRGAGYNLNLVGFYKQEKSYTDGPAAARNLIFGYACNHYSDPYWYTPSESILENELGTTSSYGTIFSAETWQPVLNLFAPGNNYLLQFGFSFEYFEWYTGLRSRVITTIDEPGGYNVIALIFHSTTSFPVHPEYSDGAANYLVIHGYDDNDEFYYISDPNTAVPVLYTAPYLNTTLSTYWRGIVW